MSEHKPVNVPDITALTPPDHARQDVDLRAIPEAAEILSRSRRAQQLIRQNRPVYRLMVHDPRGLWALWNARSRPEAAQAWRQLRLSGQIPLASLVGAHDARTQAELREWWAAGVWGGRNLKPMLNRRHRALDWTALHWCTPPGTPLPEDPRMPYSLGPVRAANYTDNSLPVLQPYSAAHVCTDPEELEAIIRQFNGRVPGSGAMANARKRIQHTQSGEALSVATARTLVESSNRSRGRWRKGNAGTPLGIFEVSAIASVWQKVAKATPEERHAALKRARAVSDHLSDGERWQVWARLDSDAQQGIIAAELLPRTRNLEALKQVVSQIAGAKLSSNAPAMRSLSAQLSELLWSNWTELSPEEIGAYSAMSPDSEELRSLALAGALVRGEDPIETVIQLSDKKGMSKAELITAQRLTRSWESCKSIWN